MSLRRRIKALCFECQSGVAECYGYACPFYDLRKANEGEAISWWKLPSRQWEEGQKIARTEGRLIEVEVFELSEAQIQAQKRGAERLRKLNQK